MALVSYLFKKGTRNTSKRNSFESNLRGRDQKASFCVCGPLSGPLGQFCGKASGVDCPVARSFVVEAKFLDFALFKGNGLLVS